MSVIIGVNKDMTTKMKAENGIEGVTKKMRLIFLLTGSNAAHVTVKQSDKYWAA